MIVIVAYKCNSLKVSIWNLCVYIMHKVRTQTHSAGNFITLNKYVDSHICGVSFIISI